GHTVVRSLGGTRSCREIDAARREIRRAHKENLPRSQQSLGTRGKQSLGTRGTKGRGENEVRGPSRASIESSSGEAGCSRFSALLRMQLGRLPIPIRIARTIAVGRRSTGTTRSEAAAAHLLELLLLLLGEDLRELVVHFLLELSQFLLLIGRQVQLVLQ